MERKKNIEKNLESGKTVIIENLAVLADVRTQSIEVGEEEQEEAKDCVDLGS